MDGRKLKSLLKILTEFGVTAYRDKDIQVELGPKPNLPKLSEPSEPDAPPQQGQPKGADEDIEFWSA